MRIFLIGDYTSKTGPANVTKKLLLHLPKDTLKLRYWNKILRLSELWLKIPKSDICLISGYSRQNLHALKICRIFHKKAVYLMHGCVEYENDINQVPDPSMNKVERATLSGADRIFAVSKQFEDWLKEHYPQYADKITHLTNGVDWHVMKETASGERRDPYQLLSVGGGMPRKRIYQICKAVELLRNEGLPYTLVVAGDVGKDTEKINAFSFVKNIGLVSGEEMMHQMHISHIFIQNSCFETFGLAPLEALLCGCDILLSKAVGALSLFQEIQDGDIIYDCEDPVEIAEKIKKLAGQENHSRLLVELNKESTSWEARSEQLQTMLKQIAEEKS